MISKDEKSKKVQQAELKLAQAKAQLAKVKRAERKELEKIKSHHKFIMGGIIAKYFPECYSFSEKELARILASAIKSRECENVLYSDFESALPYYKSKGILIGDDLETTEFNDIMNFLYLGRKEKIRELSNETNPYVILNFIS